MDLTANEIDLIAEKVTKRLEQSLLAKVESGLGSIKELISDISNDSEYYKLERMQQICLSKKELTISEVAKAQLLGKKYTKVWVKKLLKEYVYKKNGSNKDWVITSAVIQYREVNNIV